MQVKIVRSPASLRLHIECRRDQRRLLHLVAVLIVSYLKVLVEDVPSAAYHGHVSNYIYNSHNWGGPEHEVRNTPACR